MLSQCLLLSTTKKVISYSLVLGQQPQPFKYKIKVIQYILNQEKVFFLFKPIYFISQILASKNIKAFQSLSKLQFLTFMTKVNPDDENKTKSQIFNGTYSNLTSFSIDHKIQALAWRAGDSLRLYASPVQIKKKEA